jgi:transposase InsO family protein
VSQSWFYKWRDGRPGPRAERRDRLKAEVARLFRVHEGKYGSPRVTADLRDAGWRVSQNTVAALMREQGLAARRKKKRKSTTRPGKGRWRAPDLVRRDFPACQLNRKWFGDGTQIVTDEGRLHLVSVLEVASRRVLGFTLGERHDAQLAYGALAMALTVRGGQVPGVIFHTDRAANTPPSCSAPPASGWASPSRWAIESWHSTLEFELRAVEHFATKAAARTKVAAWIEDYNTSRRHSACQMMSPVNYEKTLAA